MFDIGSDRNMYFALGMFQTYIELEEDPKKKSVLVKIMSDILSSYTTVVLPMINELGNKTEGSEDEN